jgi:hypothetical protein
MGLNLAIVAKEAVGMVDMANELTDLVDAKNHDELDELVVAEGCDEFNKCIVIKGCDELDKLIMGLV